MWYTNNLCVRIFRSIELRHIYNCNLSRSDIFDVTINIFRGFSSTHYLRKERNCYLLIVGGGAGGCSVGAKFVRKLGKGKVVIVDPCDSHFYQPMFTLVGGGIKDVTETVRPMKEVLPNDAVWIKDLVTTFDPDNNLVLTKEGLIINYEYLVIACGLILNFHSIKGLSEALLMEESGVCSNYTPEFAQKTFRTLKNLKEGNAVFNFPSGPVKCGGAPLKACYISEHYARLKNKRERINFCYKTSLPVIFIVEYYAGALMEVCFRRNIKVDFKRELIMIKPEKKQATFRLLDKTFQLETVEYSMLHVTPPMSTPPELKAARSLTDKLGFLDVDKYTLQHVSYKNIFGIGDCSNLPTAKTAAAVGTQANILFKNLSLVMDRKPIGNTYNGYTSCPIVTGYGTCILAEFDYEHNPIETLPINQRKERSVSYYLKKDVMPMIYWNLGLKGYWNGPAWIRKLTHLGFV